jgi:hypothetical protein
MKPKKTEKSGRKSIKKMVPLAGLAMKQGFYLDASLILSSIMEARLRSIIAKAGKEDPGPGFSLEKCITRIKYILLHDPDPVVGKNFDLSLVGSLRTWKNHRNDIFKDLARIHVSKERMEKLAGEGVSLLRELDRSHKKFKAEWKTSLHS